ncbi:hypothetical protein F7725_007587 [Dissostichus mawsoni]|uniref:Uncharacterized protein n=1 Tax=Dissostichus mawsoni TaxID=36200 RepID=A0A7J5Y4T7_DISMA|nr:hypothetical protein F7725_007587 [Dissostichus mawsoni]
MSIRSPIYSNHMFPPSVMDFAFKIWNNGGIRSFEDLYINKVFASFSQLTETFCIPPGHLFRYFQIRSFTRSKYPQFPNKPAETTLDRILEINVQNRGICKVKCTPSPLTAIFGVVPDDIFLSRHYSNAVAFASLIARRHMIMRRRLPLISIGWKQEASPTHVHWVTEFMKFLHMEKIKCILGGSTCQFYRTWQPFLTYMESLKLPTLP